MSNKRKILVVDDVAVSLSITEQALRDYYDVITINSGERALRYLEEDKPNLILLDIGMEPMDGIQTLKEIRKMENCQDIPVIMLTGRDDKLSVWESSKLGIDSYVLKPFKANDLLDRVKKALMSNR